MLDVSKFDTSNVTRMGDMFRNCSRLSTLDVSGFDTSNVTNMPSMFNGCNNLTTLDLSGFNTSSVKDMGHMFYSCGGLTTIYVSEYNEETKTGWTTSAVINSDSMFNGCTKLVGENGTTYDAGYTDGTYARIDTVETPGYFTNITNKN